MSQVVVGSPTPRAALRGLKQPVYDTQEAPGAGAPVNLLTWFQTPIGGALNVTGAAKTAADTSLTQASMLGVPNEFDLWGFNFTFTMDDGYRDTGGAPTSIANFAADMVLVYEGSVFKFFFGQQRPFVRVPLSRIPQGAFFLTGPLTDLIATENVFPIALGGSNKEEYYRFLSNEKPVHIGPAETFTARVEWPLAAFGLSADGTQSRMTCYLIGVLYTAL